NPNRKRLQHLHRTTWRKGPTNRSSPLLPRVDKLGRLFGKREEVAESCKRENQETSEDPKTKSDKPKKENPQRPEIAKAISPTKIHLIFRRKAKEAARRAARNSRFCAQ